MSRLDQFEFLSNRFSRRNPTGDDLLIDLNGNVDVGQGRERQAGVFDAQAELMPLSACQK